MCLTFSGAVPLRIVKKAVVDGLLFPKSSKDFETTDSGVE
jgi:hypothetical protein